MPLICQIVMRRSLTSLLFYALFHATIYGSAQDTTDLMKPKPSFSYGPKGFEFLSANQNYLLHLEFRGQFRMAYPTDTDPITFDDFNKQQLYLKLNRARMKVGGHAYKPWFKYYIEYELAVSKLLDFRMMFEQLPYLKLKVGQWKAQYNRERIISSGKQQTLERSLLTRKFTIDRQQGISLFGRLDGAGALDFNYWVSAFMGTGRGARENDDKYIMWMTRWQWNFTGQPLAFEGSDTKYHEKFTGILALAAVTNQSPYTRFSTSGGGQLEGFEEGVAGQYRVHQWMQESAFMVKGISFQQELHWKQINDNVNNTQTTMMGNLAQIGYFFHYWWSAIPKNMELYFRHAIYQPDIHLDSKSDHEYSFGSNWFIKGHRNKLTAEISYFEYSFDSEQLQNGARYRLQWDLSF
jgi:hypothetical protein